MQIIANIKALGLDNEVGTTPFSEFLKNTDREGLLTEIFDGIQDQFDDQADVADAYLSSMDPSDVEENITFGAEAPEKIIQIAKDWNQTILNMVLAATKKALPFLERGELDGQHTYELSCTARMADNHWFWCADYATYIASEDHQYPFFCVLLEPKDVEDIEAHPENYIVLDVYPK